MKTVALGEVAKFIRGVTFKPGDVLDEANASSTGVMRTKNVQSKLDLSDVLQIPRGLVRREEQYLRGGDILVSSANSWNLVGRCCWVPKLEKSAAIGGFVTGLRANSRELDARYLYHWFSSPRTQATVRNTANQTTNIANLNLRLCEALRLPLPPLDEQRRIAAILDHADALRVMRRRSVDALAELNDAAFIDCFGHVPEPSTLLNDVATVSSGITKGRRTTDATSPMPYLAVANVQAGRLELSSVKTIDATSSEIERYRLKFGDLVLTEGGDPDKLGRGTVWRDELPLCLHQNHIFRVRIQDSSSLHPDYLSAFISSNQSRSYFLKSAKQTTGIASINMTQLKALPVHVPTAEAQLRYLDLIQSINAQRATVVASASSFDRLFASLQSRAFRGEL
ncbi:restriction endonuclease subunit S [Mycobacterium sp. SMC-21]|uniref:restriction endonuclease subunit S n=1 Tax=Mycobacterium sp. SMC-21 TaxID=3381632 RepID=UPI003877367A